MTNLQVVAIEQYIDAVVRIMGKHGEHASNVRLVLDARKRLELAFGEKLPIEYPYLLSLPATPEMPDIL